MPARTVIRTVDRDEKLLVAAEGLFAEELLARPAPTYPGGTDETDAIYRYILGRRRPSGRHLRWTKRMLDSTIRTAVQESPKLRASVDAAVASGTPRKEAVAAVCAGFRAAVETLATNCAKCGKEPCGCCERRVGGLCICGETGLNYLDMGTRSSGTFSGRLVCEKCRRQYYILPPAKA